MSNGLSNHSIHDSRHFQNIDVHRPAGQDNVMDKINSHIQELSRWSVWRAIFLGQLLSVLNMCTGVTSQLLTEEYNVSIPTAQTFANYVLLCLLFTTWLALRSGDEGIAVVLRRRGWKYVILAAFDVEANYLVVKAYNYTTLTSITLLDCFAIPTVLAMSWIFLKVRYKLLHIIGVSICLVGVGCLVWADIEEGRGSVGGQDRLVGDMLCLGGATLYGISNVGQEFVVKNFNIVEFLGMMGLFGSVINGVQLAVLERDEVMGVDWSDWRVAALLAGFSLAQFTFYVMMPVVVRVTSATSVNLSLLTSDFFSLIAGILLFHFKFHVLYFLSFFLVICGIVVYSSKPTPIPTRGDRPYREMSQGSASADVELNTPNTSVNELPRSVSDVSSVPSYGTLVRDMHSLPRSRSIPDRPYNTLGRPSRREAAADRPYRTLERSHGGARVHWAAEYSPNFPMESTTEDRTLEQFTTFSAHPHPVPQYRPEGILKTSKSLETQLRRPPRQSLHVNPAGSPSPGGDSSPGLEDVQC
ncbi:solute carrier family 35 member F2-like isoform X1 [Amphibalanus amphitrite]|uniref:solute carrier family 35 member F2-like isoform X1 n=1 Tax=Amphibalanus amphitrite TaxID=1232801 RepID=UPI001C909BF7|nr:solute carrier family 35 member F2-like isoform X1 [Amphibalanus amphitrite]XP_043226336.1 solute carrier family 35 member F2-like isoform X1 [Amphibalanus amphitrite]XP_043226337.1 solute carrier family 35 member F2-like isoform X1 [Amphibalanus amphitrite]XP_043226338.1 solute carrier family 35 member F2-like isoform X1 [Amphibalanus amphitrite]XP_043226339.1 solute carrier family 35 member F2-like isoform X1 [Amphibalanus amphitrite]XP_043226340.1 solute carrier family 35 member F2-like 